MDFMPFSAPLFTGTGEFTAAGRAIHTTEIFENIVGFLPWFDVENARKVPRWWKDRIDTSFKLGQSRYLIPGKGTCVRPIFLWANIRSEFPTGHFVDPGDGLMADADSWEASDLDGPRVWADGNAFVGREVMNIHPLMRPPFSAETYHNLEPHVYIALPWDLNKVLSWAPGGNWESVLLTQPPCKEIEMMVLDVDPDGWAHWKIRVTIRDPVGITLGMVIRTLRSTPGIHTISGRETWPNMRQSSTQIVGMIPMSVRAGSRFVKQAERYEQFWSLSRTQMLELYRNRNLHIDDRLRSHPELEDLVAGGSPLPQTYYEYDMSYEKYCFYPSDFEEYERKRRSFF